jgi:hypothetical protein
MQPQTIGNIDERGYLNGMRRRGYTPQKCLLELGANSCDASQGQDVGPDDQKKFVAAITRETIRLIDNSAGMGVEGLENMFSLHRSNHSDHKSMGVSGIGAKPALLILGETTTVNVSTRTRDGTYIIATVPWKEIMDAGRYTGMVTRREMTTEERDAFRDERAKHGMLIRGQPVGTTIEFQHNDMLEDILVHQAIHPNPLDRIGVVFGHVTDYTFEVIGSDGKQTVLKKYNYFHGHRPEFYNGVRRDMIEHYFSAADNNDRFIWKRADGDYEINRDGRGLAKEAKKMVKNLQGYRLVGTFEVATGCRVDHGIFDLSAPADVQIANGYTHTYDVSFFGKELDYNSKAGTALIRNRQYIGNIPIPDIKASSARSNLNYWFDMMLVHQELEYFPPSHQDNHQDVTMNIQENKNQFDGSAVPLALRRLLRDIRNETAGELRAYFDQCRREHLERQAAAAAAPVADQVIPEEEEGEEESLPDSESESEVEPEAAPAAERVVTPPPVAPLPLPDSPGLESVPGEAEVPPQPLPVPRGIPGQALQNMLQAIKNRIAPLEYYEEEWLLAQIADGLAAFES